MGRILPGVGLCPRSALHVPRWAGSSQGLDSVPGQASPPCPQMGRILPGVGLCPRSGQPSMSPDGQDPPRGWTLSQVRPALHVPRWAGSSQGLDSVPGQASPPCPQMGRILPGVGLCPRSGQPSMSPDGQDPPRGWTLSQVSPPCPQMGRILPGVGLCPRSGQPSMSPDGQGPPRGWTLSQVRPALHVPRWAGSSQGLDSVPGQASPPCPQMGRILPGVGLCPRPALHVPRWAGSSQGLDSVPGQASPPCPQMGRVLPGVGLCPRSGQPSMSPDGQDPPRGWTLSQAGQPSMSPDGQGPPRGWTLSQVRPALHVPRWAGSSQGLDSVPGQASPPCPQMGRILPGVGLCPRSGQPSMSPDGQGPPRGWTLSQVRPALHVPRWEGSSQGLDSVPGQPSMSPDGQGPPRGLTLNA
ncbi:basic salivary proline-rich protein 4-like [Coregonus clupeaformis]|uniref:basic salivary proline-rich protein 4-like n=1 Tax=Coregonus clupeaformis TaxID=59861 RepID=UPI001E1C3A8B|nr:basic salivary proline-rich protein 4-like [Coregonus clupeaformis]